MAVVPDGERQHKKKTCMEDSRMQTAIQTQSRCPAVAIDRFIPRMLAHSGLGVWSHFLANVFTLLLLSPLVAHATLSIPVSEDDLAQYAAAIVVGQVKEIESYWDDNAKQVFTHITVTVQETLKGDVNAGEFTVKQLGGTIGHLHSWVVGSPEFTVGEKVLLFLDTNADGSAGVAHLYQGKLSVFIDRDTGNEVAYRGETPDGVQVLTNAKTAKAQTASTSSGFYEMTALTDRIREVLQTAPTEQRAFSAPFPLLQIPPGSTAEKQEGFVVVGIPPVRWFEPDSGIPVTMSLNPTNILPTGEEQIDAAFHAWNAARQSTFRFNKGPITDSIGFKADGVNAISFNDPSSQLPDPMNCSGVLAAAEYVTVSDESRTLHEQTFLRILEADLVFANGWENCTAFKSSANIAEVATHELGHVLGLNHSPNPDATMFRLAHFDGRGAALHPDDEKGVAFLYPDASFPPCTYGISPSKRTLAGGATSGKITVSTRDGCGWTAGSTVPWISISEGSGSSGTGTVVYAVEANSAKTARRGSIVVAGKTFAVTQKGASSRSGIPRFFAR